jgi:hypothetical protein
MPADTERALGRLEGMALSGFEKSIAQAVALAVAPLIDEIRELRLQVEKLQQVATENQSRENAPQAAIIPLGDQTLAVPKQSPQRGARARKLTAWQRIGARILGIR